MPRQASGHPGKHPGAALRSRAASLFTIRKPVVFGISFVCPLLLVLLRPLGMDLGQSAVLASLVLVIIWWVSGAVHRLVASCVLLVLFCLFGRTPPTAVFSFPLSPGFYILILSFVFSQGVLNSGLVEKLVTPFLVRHVRSRGRLILTLFICALAFIFIIPQPYSRVILLSIVFTGFCNAVGMGEDARKVVLFGLFTFSLMMNNGLLQGDIVLNTAALGISGIQLGELGWAARMLPPTLVFCALAGLLYAFVYKKHLVFPKPADGGTTGGDLNKAQAAALSGRDKRNLVFIVVFVLFWALTPVHGVDQLITIAAGTLLMFLFGLARLRDLATIDVTLLVFVTAAFSIGSVMRGSGVADLLFNRFIPLFPSGFSFGFVLAVVLICMAMHMVLGSNITTMSIMIPGLFTIAAGRMDDTLLMLLIVFSICAHFLLPFHNVIIMVGEGRGCYDGKTMLRFTLPLTVLVVASAMALYLGWWRIAGFL